MNIRRAVLLTVLSPAGIACGASANEPTAQPPPAGSQSAAPLPGPASTPTTAASDSATATNAPAPAAKAAHDADGADGVRRWASWSGPKTGAAVATKRAWVIAPNLSAVGSDKQSFASVYPRVADVVKAEANEVVFEEKWGKYAVPPALARATAAPKGLKKGSVVRCPFGGNSAVARIDASDAKTATCAFRFMGRVEKAKVPIEEVLLLDGTLQMGAPVQARFHDGTNASYKGIVVAVAGDKVWARLDTQFSDNDARGNRAVHELDAADVHPMDLSMPLKVGDACVASAFGTFEPCKVTKILDGSLGYAVSFEGSRNKDLDFDSVDAAPKGK